MSPPKITLFLLLLITTSCQTNDRADLVKSILEQLPPEKKLSELSKTDEAKALIAIRDSIEEVMCNKNFVDFYCLQSKSHHEEIACLKRRSEIEVRLKATINTDDSLKSIFFDETPADVVEFFRFGKVLTEFVLKDRAAWRSLRRKPPTASDSPHAAEDNLRLGLKKHMMTQLNIDEARFELIDQQSYFLHELLAQSGIKLDP